MPLTYVPLRVPPKRSGIVKQKLDGALYPDEVAIAAAAFQAALTRLDGSTYADTHSVRRCLAEYISAHALMGELEVDALRDGALRYLQNGFMRPARREPFASPLYENRRSPVFP